GNRFFANRNLLQRRVEQATQPGKTDVLFNSRVTGTDTTSPDKLRCNVAMNVATGDWTLTQNIGIGFNYCDAVCFK
ncbi:hypothetical protein ACFA8O_005391, partial [Salmonella enterica]